MVNVLTNTKSLSFSKAEIFNGKSFAPIIPNSIYKMSSAIFKFDDKIYATNGLTIASAKNQIDILLEEELEKTKNLSGDYKDILKKIKRYISSYEGKFQFGLTYKEIEMLAGAKAALTKYQMLKKLNLEIVMEVKHD